MVAVVELETAAVDTVKVAVVLPEAMITAAGTVAATSLLDRVTVTPPVGADADSVTVLWELLPPVTLVGLRSTEDTESCLIWKDMEEEVVPSGIRTVIEDTPATATSLAVIEAWS